MFARTAKKQILTKRQHQVLTLLYKFIKNEGYAPSFQNLKELLGVVSNQSVTDFLRSLEKKGLIRRGDGNARGLSISPTGYDALGVQPLLPVLGTSRGGALTDIIERHGEWKTVSPEISRLANRSTFLIQVHGDSMEGVIWNNDIVLVMPVNSALEIRNRDIVLVEVNGETTVKRYIARGGRKYLEPENPRYSPISITPDMKIVGKVIARL